MPRITGRRTVTPDHKITVNVPENWPEGSEVEAVIKPVVPSPSGNAGVVGAAIREAHAKATSIQRVGRTREEIDAEAAAFRDEWE